MLNLLQMSQALNYLINEYGTTVTYISRKTNINVCTISNIVNKGKLNYEMSEDARNRLSDFISKRIDVDNIK